VLRHSEKASCIDDGVGDRLVARNDDVVDRSDPFVAVIVDRMPEDLAFGAPAQGNVAQFRDTDAENSLSSHLRIRDGRRG
jgi:hypothetical protein